MNPQETAQNVSGFGQNLFYLLMLAASVAVLTGGILYWTLIDIGAGKIEKDQIRDKLKSDLSNYIYFEYYRQSSLAKATHKEMLRQRKMYIWKDTQDGAAHTDAPQCRCALCRARITEHMRWNAYMRVNGYRYGKNKNEMAKIHQDLRPWMELPEQARIKD